MKCFAVIAGRPSITVPRLSPQRMGSSPGGGESPGPSRETLGGPVFSLQTLWRVFKLIQSVIKSEIGSFLEQEFTSEWLPPFNQPVICFLDSESGCQLSTFLCSL